MGTPKSGEEAIVALRRCRRRSRAKKAHAFARQ
jgi:hypothetical protein